MAVASVVSPRSSHAAECEAGTVMLEAAIVLPVFFLLVYFIIALNNVSTKYSALMSALNGTTHALQGATAIQAISEADAFQYAGDLFYDQVKKLGLDVNDIDYDPAANGAHYVLIGTPQQLPSHCSDTPASVYQLRAKFRPQGWLGGLVPNIHDVYVSTLVVIEASNAVSRPPGHTNDVLVYSPSMPAGSRVSWKNKATVPS